MAKKATKKATPKKAAAKKPTPKKGKTTRQGFLPGAEPPEPTKRLIRLGEDLRQCRAERVSLQDKEAKIQESMIREMKEQGLKHYQRDGVEYELSVSDPTEKIKTKKIKQEADG